MKELEIVFQDSRVQKCQQSSQLFVVYCGQFWDTFYLLTFANVTLTLRS